MVSLSKNLSLFLKSLPGYACLVIFFLLGEAMHRGFNLPIPGAVLGMILLFLARSYIPYMVPQSTVVAAHQLISAMALLLLPAAVGIFFLPPAFHQQLPAIGGAIILGTVISLVLTSLLMSRLLGQTAQRDADD